MIDFNDVQGLMDFYRDFMSSHDVENVDFSGYRKIRLGDDDLREYVLGSRAYEVLKDKPIRKIQVWVDET